MEKILKELNVSNTLIKLFKGEVPVITEFSMFKYYIKESKQDAFPHPPFLIPIFYSYDADHYHIGLIKHWFTDRELSYGDMTDGTGFSTIEIARSEEQFFHKYLFEGFVRDDCIITNRMMECAKEFEIDESYFNIYDELNTRKENYDYCNLDILKKNVPLECIKKEEYLYKGDFPTAGDIIIPKNLENACFCEISHLEWLGYPPKKQGFSLFKKKPKYEPLPNIPEWLKPDTNKKDLFEKYINQKDYSKAWLTINGSGFTPKEVGERMQRLKEFSNEKGYHLWADFWCEKYGEQDSFIFM